MSETKTLKLICIFLGFLSIANNILLGIYITQYCLAIAFLTRFFIEANIVGFATAISVALILFGSYLIYKDHYLHGGLFNIGAGTITLGLYLYYTLNLPVLQHFGLLGYFLLLPPFTSGIISIAMSPKNVKS